MAARSNFRPMTHSAYDGIVDTSATNGGAGSLLIDPANLTIHSGTLNGFSGSNYYVSADALATDLHLNAAVTLLATNEIDVGATTGQTGFFWHCWRGRRRCQPL